MAGWGLNVWGKQMPANARIKKTNLQTGQKTYTRMNAREWKAMRSEHASTDAEKRQKKYEERGEKIHAKQERREEAYIEKGERLKKRYKERGVKIAQRFAAKSDANAIKYYTKALANNPITRDAVVRERIGGQPGFTRDRAFRTQFDRGRNYSTSESSRGRVFDLSPYGRGKVYFRKG